MNPVVITVAVSDEAGRLDPVSLRIALEKTSNLTSKRIPVIVKLRHGNSGKIHLQEAKKYSNNLSSVRQRIRAASAFLVITALRTARVPTHTTAFENERMAKEFLKKNMAAAVV